MMQLIEAYIFEVTKRLPEKSRDDIALELNSTIEDTLPENYSEQDVVKALSELGDPAQLAASYRDTHKYLIGPKVYHAYSRVLKIIIPWVALITVLVYIVEGIVHFSEEASLLSVLIKGFGMIIAIVIQNLIQTIFWVTVIFLIIERVGLSGNLDSLTNFGQEWTPEDLKHIKVIPKKKAISKGEVIFGFVLTAVWLVFYFNADHLAGIYQSIDGNNLQMVMPIFDQTVWLSYWPLILIIAFLEIGLGVYKWKVSHWTMQLVAANTVVKIVGIIAFIIIASNPALLNAAVIPYMADLLNVSIASVGYFIDWAIWTIVAITIITLAIEIFDSYRKAKIRL